LLDVDAALSGEHSQVGALGAVDEEGEVVLLRDVRALGDHHLVHRMPLDLQVEDPGGGLPGLLRRLGDGDAAGFAAAAGSDLGFDHGDATDPGGGILCFVGGAGDGGGQDGNVVGVEKLACLVLEEIHHSKRRHSPGRSFVITL